MYSIKVLGALAVVALLLTSMSCESGSSTTSQLGGPRESLTPSGELMLSGAISATLTAAGQGSRAGCQAISQTPLPPATDNTVFLAGEVDFGSGSSALALIFQGIAGTTKLPLPGPSIPASVEIVDATNAEWYAGQSSQTSSGSVTLSGSGAGTIHGSVDASLAPLRGSSAQLHLTGTWNC